MQGLALVPAQAQTLIQSEVQVQGYSYREVPHSRLPLQVQGMRNLPVRVSLNVNSTLNQSLSLSPNKSKTLHQTMYPTLAVSKNFFK